MIDDTPEKGYNSDPNVLIDGDSTYLFWRQCFTPLCDSIRTDCATVGGCWLGEPAIVAGKTTGYSLVRSEHVDCKVGSHCSIMAPYVLHHVQIGDYSYIARNATASRVEIGKFCSIGPNFCCGLGIHPTNGISTAPMFYSTKRQNGVSLVNCDKVAEHKTTHIGHDVFIGANVTVLDGVTIGHGAVIGAGAVVVCDIPAYAVAVGVPARVVKYRFAPDVIDRLLEVEWWHWPEERLQEVVENEFNVEAWVEKEFKVDSGIVD